MKKLGILMPLCSFFALLFTAGCGEQAHSENDGNLQGNELKVALLLPGPINDMGFNSLAYNGLLAAKEQYGCEIGYHENVAQSDMESTLRNYASAGYDLIILHGYQFNDAAEAVAPDFPNVNFLVTSSDITNGDNLASVNVNNTQVGFLLGIMAGVITETGKVGYIGGVEIPSVVNTGKGMGIGVGYVNPNVEYIETYTGSFDDVNNLKETAISIIDSGADVMAACANQAGLGSIEACAEKGVWALGVNSDQKDAAPDTVISSAILDFSSCIPLMVGKLIDGTYKAQYYDLGINEGLVYLTPFEDFKEQLGAEKVARIEQAIQDLKDGKVDLS